MGLSLLAPDRSWAKALAGGTTVAELRKIADAGTFARGEPVVAVITGNGLKTLPEHPPKRFGDAELSTTAMTSRCGRAASTARPSAVQYLAQCLVKRGDEEGGHCEHEWRVTGIEVQ